MDKLKGQLQQIDKALASFGSFRKRWGMLDGLGRFLSWALGAFLIWFFLDWAIKLPAWPLVLLFVAVVVIALVSIWKWLLKPVMKTINIENEAVVAEQLHGDLDNRIIGSKQLGKGVLDGEHEELGYSPNLVLSLVEHTIGKLNDIKLTSLIDLKAAKKALGTGIVILICVVCLGVFAQEALKERFSRLADAYAQVLDTLFPVDIEVEPKNKAVVRGLPLQLKVHVVGARRTEAVLVMTDKKTGEIITKDLTLVDDKASYTIKEADQDFSYKFGYSGRFSEEYTILVDDLPIVKAINFEITPPGYTGQPMRMMTGRVAKLKGLTGTSVLVSFAANTRLAPDSCYVKWKSGTTDKIDISGRFGSFQFQIRENTKLAIHLTGHHGKDFQMAQPMVILIEVVPDAPPSLHVTTKIANAELGASQAAGLQLGYFAKDDFGVQKIELFYKIESQFAALGMKDRKGHKIHALTTPRDRVKNKFRGIFSGNTIKAGDKVTLWLKATDNNTETGPGIAQTKRFEFTVIGNDLGQFTAGDPMSMKRKRESSMLLVEVERVKRKQDLLQDPERMVRTEVKKDFIRMDVSTNVRKDVGSGSSEEFSSQYFQLLSGGGND
ncbi:MAG: DUF4175 family protein [Lentisphaeria bacterium]|nr:DUF4175 domain-containing protein [Lentisphaeria bacterium]NQZ66469.1 DUF4175 family protein [Lentisphaeria bacterium]